ncbi:ABC transporter permease [Aerococcaceae bacterium zg-ZJ1578]|uniref:ABC transporter permease n=1 Tax=Aerococcaceae TaxID=186827 RepID=UPI0013BB2B3C|nr:MULTISPECIES: ABC transporter permease [unclassified Facklamia]MBK0348149.1 ABC transporter permease [Aerococcaceae bacterium zg-1578]MBS4461434.1 ABC transporter permease [Aerococcaceae bacterium zg-B36]QQD65800.1 ABC transporter permease [Aerococcaceae bacterium zg-252]NEW64093.1 ABC transporter permease subunit [Facklamia sp. 252]NEW67551.1 ABC transporter permease subunit [Facklamia sp. 253]
MELKEKDLVVEQELTKEEPVSLPPMGFEVIKREFLKDKVAIGALILLVLILGASILVPYFIDMDAAMKVSIFDRFLKPGVDGHILGTDEGGRDVFGMLVAGTRNSLFIGWSVTVLTAVIGIALGIISGYYGGKIDDVMMRVVDFVMVLPTLMFTIVMISITEGFSMIKLVLILSVFAWPGITRLVRTAALSEASKDYISASKTMGTRDWKIILFELLPNLSSILITNLTLSFAANIGLETGLSFLGFGLPVGTPSIGTLIGYANNPDTIENKTWVWLPAVLLVLVLMLCVNYIGQALQRAADSRQRRG